MIAEDISFCASLIGKPWVSGASGPDAFDCWGLLRFVFAARRGFLLPAFEGLGTLGLAGVMKTAKAQAAEWERIESPVHFAAVGISENRAIHHVGIWLDEAGGGILHSFQGGGVVFQTQAAMRSKGMQHFNFYNRKP